MISDSYKAVGPNLYVDPSTGQMYNNQLQGDSENGFTRAMVPTGDIWEYQNTPGISGQNIYGSQGYSPQQYEKGGEGDWGSTGSPGGFTAAGYQLGNWQSDPNLSSYLQSRGITPTYDAQYGWIIPNAANPGQIMTDYVRSRGLGDANTGGFVNSLIDKYAVPGMMAATGAGMAGGFGGVAAEGGGAGATTGVTVPGNYSSAMGTMGGDVAAGAGTTSAYGLTGAAPGIAGTAGGGITGMGAPVDYSLASGAGAGANVGSAGLGGTSAMLGGAGAAGGAAAGAAGAGAASGLASWLTPASIAASALFGSNAAGNAANTQAAAQDRANALNYSMYLQGRQDLAPYAGAGITAQNKLLTYLGLPGGTQGDAFGRYAGDFSSADFLANKDPGYGFRFSEGLKGLDRSAAARGGLLSGATLKGAERFGQDLASTEYQNAFNRYQTNRANALGPLDVMRASGQSAAAGQAGIAGNYGASGAAGQTALGNIGAAGTMGQANALASGLGQYLNYSSNADLSNAIRTSAYGRPVTNALGVS